MNGVVDLNGRALLPIQVRALADGPDQPLTTWVDTGRPRAGLDRIALSESHRPKVARIQTIRSRWIHHFVAADYALANYALPNDSCDEVAA